jgi:hypothetical protein
VNVQVIIAMVLIIVGQSRSSARYRRRAELRDEQILLALIVAPIGQERPRLQRRALDHAGKDTWPSRTSPARCLSIDRDGRRASSPRR